MRYLGVRDRTRQVAPYPQSVLGPHLCTHGGGMPSRHQVAAHRAHDAGPDRSAYLAGQRDEWPTDPAEVEGTDPSEDWRMSLRCGI